MSKKPKVLLIGWDAADWKVIGPLMAKGQMPALKSIIDRGVYGNMSTMNPPYSPMLWSTVATGKTPDKHGVLGFIELKSDLKGIQPVTVNSRKSRALWNIFHNQGLKSNVIGWWPSFPAEPINGVVVTDAYQKVSPDPSKKNSIRKGTIHPESLTDELRELRVFPYEITDAHILPFMPKASQIDQEKDRGLQSFAKILSQNASIHAATTQILRTTNWDFSCVYYDLIDHFCHGFMKYHPPKLKAVPQSLFDIYNQNVVGAYKFQDMMLERKLQLIDEDTTVIVMSDHGFESGHKRILKMPKYPAAPSLEHRQFGIFVAAGPNIKKNEKVFGLGLIDIAPTILHMFDLPIGRDMDGKVALDIFINPKPPKYIDSWENVEGDFAQHSDQTSASDINEKEAMDQLIELGYIEKPDEKIETAILRTACDIKHNLARVYAGKKDYANAKPLLLELIKEKPPIDTVPYFMDLLSISLAEKEFDLAETYLVKLRSMDKQFKINTYFSEAKILEGQGKLKKALKVLQNVIDKKPNAQLWYQIAHLYYRLSDFEDAKSACLNAINYETDNARAHQLLAATYIRLGLYEDAVDHALVSIELVKFFPEAHYTLGEALEKLGDLENAKIAYETATRLKPKTHKRAEKAIENVNHKLTNVKNDHIGEFKYYKNQIVIVSGLPRSGTSVMMQMLNASGVEPLTDDKRLADESNPKGYFEYQPVMRLHKDNSWLGKAKNKSLKVVAPLLKFLDPQYRYKVIFMTRDLAEVIKSQRKMIGKDDDILPTRLLNTYKKHLEMVKVWKDKEPNVDFMYVDYKDVLHDTNITIKRIEDFLQQDLDRVKMKACVDKSLYRNRV